MAAQIPYWLRLAKAMIKLKIAPAPNQPVPRAIFHKRRRYFQKIKPTAITAAGTLI